MQKLWLKNIRFPEWALAVCLFIITFLMVGPLITDLGYYIDDWSAIAAYRLQGQDGLMNFFVEEDRPLNSIVYLIGFPVFGFNPLHWQITILIVRWLTAVVFWMILRKLWPAARSETALTAIVFAAYPVFRQQPSALTFIMHWLCFLLFTLSIYTMILSIQKKKWMLPLAALSILLTAFQLVMSEYFIGLEFVRPLILWYLVGQAAPVVSERLATRERLKRTLTSWMPYAGVIIVFVLWRFVWMPQGGRDRNTPDLLIELVSTPLQGILNLLRFAVQDFIEIVVSTWFKVINPALISISTPVEMLAWASALAAFLVSILFLLKMTASGAENQPHSPARQMIVIGLAAIFFGFLPGWAVGRHLFDVTGLYNDRFGIASTFGAALFVTGLMWELVPKRAARILIFTILVGLSVGWSIQNINNYRWSWIKQTRFYYQLAWRAPDIKPGTPLYSEGLMFPYMGTWTTSFAVNQTYSNSVPADGKTNLWLFDLNSYDIQYAIEVGGISASRNTFSFDAPVDAGFAFQFEPEDGRCLWVLGPDDVQNRFISSSLRSIIPTTSLASIQREPLHLPPADLFGPEPERGWCYYYQKADLALQYQDWSQIQALWQEAAGKQLQPAHGIEYGPFIEGLAHQGEWETAASLVEQGTRITDLTAEYLCSVWDRSVSETSTSPDRENAIQEVKDSVGCTPST